MYSYKNNGICQQISSCFTILLEYITNNTKNDKIKNEKAANQVHDTRIVKNIRDENDYDEFEIL
jgi:hypothetical protein